VTSRNLVGEVMPALLTSVPTGDTEPSRAASARVRTAPAALIVAVVALWASLNVLGG
jgi:hypothetical protein